MLESDADRLSSLERRVTKLEQDGNGWWAGFNALLAKYPKLVATAAVLLGLLSKWAYDKYQTPAPVNPPVQVAPVVPQQPAPEVKGGAVPLREGK